MNSLLERGDQIARQWSMVQLKYVLQQEGFVVAECDEHMRPHRTWQAVEKVLKRKKMDIAELKRGLNDPENFWLRNIQEDDGDSGMFSI